MPRLGFLTRLQILCLVCLTSAACGRGHKVATPEDAGSSGGDAQPGAAGSVAGAPAVMDAPGTYQPAKFPLRISNNRRYLADSAGRPFLINQASSWGLMQSLSTEDATTYLDGLVARGFNTVMISAISNDKRMPGSPPAWQGIAPFEREWDFSTPNPEYFTHVDEILELAKSRGLLVLLVPCYLGFATDNTQGWADELTSGTNSAAKSLAYGRFLGARYASFDNVMWVAGGDNYPDIGSELERRLLAIVQGIHERAPAQLWTAHWNGLEDGSLATEQPNFAEYIDLNGYYAYNYDPTYQRDLDAYDLTPTKPVFHLDVSYETELGGDAASIRRRAYTALLSGAAGSSFNAGPNWYLFKNWRAMDTQGTRETTYWYRFFMSRPWQDLIPDTAHEAVTDGYGVLGDTGYVCAAHSVDWSLVIAYLPTGGSVTVDTSRLRGERGRAFWYDPTQGKAMQQAEFAADAARSFAAPSRQSWVLVVEDVAANWKAPGSEPLARP